MEEVACVMRGLEYLDSSLGGPTNEVDCPLFLLSHILFTARATDVLQAVSMVHQCTTCQFVTMTVPQNSIARLEYKHDYAGNLTYCFKFILHHIALALFYFMLKK